jgi:hypothetical protein
MQRFAMVYRQIVRRKPMIGRNGGKSRLWVRTQKVLRHTFATGGAALISLYAE